MIEPPVMNDARLLSSGEKEALKKLRLSFKAELENDGKKEYEATELLDEGCLVPLLHEVKDVLEAPDLLVTASMFSKRYAYLMTVPVLYAFSLWNVRFQPTMENVVYREKETDPYWLPTFYFHEERIHPISLELREKEREALFFTLFANHLDKMWDVLCKATSIPKEILWENTFSYLYWLYDSLVQQSEEWTNEAVKRQVEADRHFLFYEADVQLFGHGRKHPFTRMAERREAVKEKDTPPLRQTCCFSYRCGEPPTYCGTCPRKP
ncbi:hypothetical protein E2L07_13675 [Halalkalibacterium halodurans]|uniref:IucA/IucC family C-terminal-domain containing protein n=1 Tax=Halalkalibacterium halodurans TaxID=86665 RepID=UPI0010676445|nr:IucA/IucC family C-terminal-domain containing protein [Halalkalibacterium halodurans]TES52776.1 hypothetical protein E2L07_13675 [Halalkalibacterium halodurans]